MATSDFDKLFTRQVPHIHMKIFFSLDWISFKGCLEVCRIWKDVLTSESFQKVGASVYRKEIHDDLWQAVKNGQTNEVRRILSSGMVDMNFKKNGRYHRAHPGYHYSKFAPFHDPILSSTQLGPPVFFDNKSLPTSRILHGADLPPCWPCFCMPTK